MKQTALMPMTSWSGSLRRALSVLFGAMLVVTTSGQERPMKIPFKQFEFTDITYRTDVCDRQKLLAADAAMLRDSLRGLNLSVAMTNYQGVPNENAFFALDPKTNSIPTTQPGLFVVILDELARRAGFEWRNSFYDVTPINAQTGKSWTELLQWEVAHFDIAADYWARSTERMSYGISFPSGWYDGSIVLATAKPKEKGPSLWSFWLPFHASVWWSIVGGIIVTAVFYYLLERLDKSADERSHAPLTAIFLTAITFTGHFEFRPGTHPARILSWSWSFWALIMAAAYTANLASFLVSRNVEAAGPKVRTIQHAVERKTPVCVQRGAIIDEFLSDQFPTLQLIRKDSEHEVFAGLKKSWYGGHGGCGVVLTNLGTFDVYQNQRENNADCSLTSEKRVISDLPAGFATAVDSGIFCTSLVSHVLDLHLVEMRAEGFIDEAWQAHLERISTIQCPAIPPASALSADGDTFSLGLSEMGGIFILHFGLSIFALGIAVAQYWHTRLYHPQKPLRPLLAANRLSSMNVGTRNLMAVLPGRRFSDKSGVEEADTMEKGVPESVSSDEEDVSPISQERRRKKSQSSLKEEAIARDEPAALSTVDSGEFLPEKSITTEERNKEVDTPFALSTNGSPAEHHVQNPLQGESSLKDSSSQVMSAIPITEDTGHAPAGVEAGSAGDIGILRTFS